MKCPNCGGEVSVNDLKCPYCGTPNPEGVAFQADVHRRKSFNEYLRRKIQEQMRIPLLQRIINLSILFLVLLFIFQLFLSFGIYLLAESNILVRCPADYEEQMAQLYTSGSYGELMAYMDRYSLEGKDYPVYMQMCLLDYDYQEFLCSSMSCMEALEQGQVPDDYYLERAIDASEEILEPYIPAYPDIYPENQAVLESYQAEVRVQLTGLLQLVAETQEKEGNTDEIND